MPENNNTRHKSSVALILIDVINHFDFPDGDKILKNSLPSPAAWPSSSNDAGVPAFRPFMSTIISASGVPMPRAL